MVVQGKVIAGNDVDAGILLDLPVSEPETLGLGQELLLRDLASPVCLWSAFLDVSNHSGSAAFARPTVFRSLLEVTVGSHAGKAENCGLNHLDCPFPSKTLESCQGESLDTSTQSTQCGLQLCVSRQLRTQLPRLHVTRHGTDLVGGEPACIYEQGTYRAIVEHRATRRPRFLQLKQSAPVPTSCEARRRRARRR